MCNITQLTNTHTLLLQDVITSRKVRDLFAKTIHLPRAITTICVYNAHEKSFALKLKVHKSLLKLMGDFPRRF